MGTDLLVTGLARPHSVRGYSPSTVAASVAARSATTMARTSSATGMAYPMTTTVGKTAASHAGGVHSMAAMPTTANVPATAAAF